MLTTTTSVAITVVDTNRPPVFVALPAVTCVAGKPCSFPVSASDPDGGTAVVTLASLTPASAAPSTFTGGTFTWTPKHNEVGNYVATFVASDGVATTTKSIPIAVVHH